MVTGFFNIDSINSSKVLCQYKFKDISGLERLNRWLPDTQEVDADVDAVWSESESVVDAISSGTKIEVMYLALMKVVVENGPIYSDIFMERYHFLSLNALQFKMVQLETSTISLKSMLLQVYKKVTMIFKNELKNVTDRFILFWRFTAIFESALGLLKRYVGDEFTQLHTKSLLTLVLKQKDFTTLQHEYQKVSGVSY